MFSADFVYHFLGIFCLEIDTILTQGKQGNTQHSGPSETPFMVSPQKELYQVKCSSCGNLTRETYVASASRVSVNL